MWEGFFSNIGNLGSFEFIESFELETESIKLYGSYRMLSFSCVLKSRSSGSYLLRCMPGLKEFTAIIRLCRSQETSLIVIDSLYSTLSAMPTLVCHVIIDFIGDYRAQGDWDRIREILAPSGFPSIKHIDLKLMELNGDPGMMASVVNGLRNSGIAQKDERLRIISY